MINRYLLIIFKNKQQIYIEYIVVINRIKSKKLIIKVIIENIREILKYNTTQIKKIY